MKTSIFSRNFLLEETLEPDLEDGSNEQKDDKVNITG